MPRQLALLDLLGVRSRREVSRASHRVKLAMRAQVEVQGRHLGGRPPYGYRLADAGPHPNQADADWGRRRHRLEPEPATAPHVRWMFEQRLVGRSVASITRELNENGVACPSEADPERNAHRSGSGWMLTTVLAILANPRYTGRQVWGRQPRDRVEREPVEGLTRQDTIQNWAESKGWAISRKPAHPALVSEADFVAVQAVHTAPVPADGSVREYLLTGLIFCGVCGRAMDAHWSHGRPGYRCRHGRNSSRAARTDQAALLYCRQDRVLELIWHDEALHRTYPGLRSRIPETTVAYLHDRGMILVGDEDGWSLESEEDCIPLTVEPMAAMLAAKNPAQRGGDHL